MYLSVFKERKLDERLVRFFSKVENGKVKSNDGKKIKWEFDSIELIIDESESESRCYFTIDHRSIYIIHLLKESGECNIIVKRETYLYENGYPDTDFLKKKIIAFIQKK